MRGGLVKTIFDHIRPRQVVLGPNSLKYFLQGVVIRGEHSRIDGKARNEKCDSSGDDEICSHRD